MIQSGTYDTIPLTQCIASAKMQLACEQSDNDIWFEKLANEAARHMDNLGIFIKRQCILTVVDGKAKLPNGFYRLLGLRLNGTNGCAGSFIYVDQPFLNNCGCSGISNQVGLGFSVQNGASAYQIQNGFILFNSGICVIDPTTNDPVPIHSVNLAFIGLNVDEDGLMIVRPDMERGITAYLCYMYMKQNADKYPQWAMQEEKATWMAQKEWVKSNDIQNQFRNTRRQIAAISNAWITDKNWFT